MEIAVFDLLVRNNDFVRWNVVTYALIYALVDFTYIIHAATAICI